MPARSVRFALLSSFPRRACSIFAVLVRTFRIVVFFCFRLQGRKFINFVMLVRCQVPERPVFCFRSGAYVSHCCVFRFLPPRFLVNATRTFRIVCFLGIPGRTFRIARFCSFSFWSTRFSFVVFFSRIAAYCSHLFVRCHPCREVLPFLVLRWSRPGAYFSSSRSVRFALLCFGVFPRCFFWPGSDKMQDWKCEKTHNARRARRGAKQKRIRTRRGAGETGRPGAAKKKQRETHTPGCQLRKKGKHSPG